MSLEYYDLSSRQALAQLKSRTPLENVFEKWDGWKESHHMVNIWNATEARAIEVVRANFIEARRDAR